MNLAKLHETIAERIPDYECLVFRERRFTWAEVNDRSRKLASFFRKNGLGLRKERSELENWESGQDHIALYLFNGNEYLESMLGAMKCRAAAFNVNYRYVKDELIYLLKDSEAKAIIFHARFAPVLKEVIAEMKSPLLLIQVADESGNELIKGAFDYETVLKESLADPMDSSCSDDDLFIVYTGGTTGMPKGVLWRQTDIYRALISMDGLRDEAETADVYCEKVIKSGRSRKGMPLPPFMHSSGLCVAFGMWSMANTVVIQGNVSRLDMDDVLTTMEKEKVSSVSVVGDAFIRPMLDQLAKKNYQLDSMRLFSSGGATLSAINKLALREYFPKAIILDVLGSSETGRQARQMMGTAEDAESKATTNQFSDMESTTVLKKDLSGIADVGEEGFVASMNNNALGYLNAREKTLATFPVIDGKRYSVPGDQAIRNERGGFQLLGRESSVINTGGEKVFAEEVENAFKNDHNVMDVVVVGVPSERWGNAVTALISYQGTRPEENEFKNFLKKFLADYKIPKAIFFVDNIPRYDNGKLDFKNIKLLINHQFNQA